MRTILLVLTLFSLTRLYSQDSVRYIKGVQFSYFPSDIFLGIHVGKLNNRHEQRLIADVGMVRTFFQQRLFPQIGYQYAYHWVDFNFVRAGAGIRPLVNMLHVNRAAKNGYVFSEAAYLDLFLEFGKKGKVRGTGGFGPWFEQKYAELDQKYITTFKWQYFAEISLTYDFRIVILCIGLIFLTECKKKKYRDSELIGHAGAGLSIANTPYHDNTAEAVNYAVQMQGISGVEVDIQCSKDGTAWLFHDPTIDLETDGMGCVNSLTDSYLESLTYASLQKEKLVKLKDLQFPYEVKNIYFDIRTLNQCSGGEIPQAKIIEALSAALVNVPLEKINVIVLNKEWIADFRAQGWNVYYEATSASEYINLEPELLSKTIGTCVRNTEATKEEVSQIKGLGKIVMLFDFRSPSSVRKALKKGANILSIDDLKGALIEKY